MTYKPRYKPSEEEPVARTVDTRCAWQSSDSLRQCLLTGSITYSLSATTKWYCTWHARCLHNPAIADDYQAFLQWRETILYDYGSAFLQQNPLGLFALTHGKNEGTVKNTRHTETSDEALDQKPGESMPAYFTRLRTEHRLLRDSETPTRIPGEFLPGETGPEYFLRHMKAWNIMPPFDPDKLP